MTSVTAQDIVYGLRALGLDQSSTVLVHSSLRSFGHVAGGASSVCDAIATTCGTAMFPAATWDLTGLSMAPPGLVRPHNAYRNASSWDEFDAVVNDASPFSRNLPIDRELGIIPETVRMTLSPARSLHPLMSYIAIGENARVLLDGQQLDWPLGSIDALEQLDGHVLLLGVGHTSNTAIHLAEQRLGRSRFWRYARTYEGIWIELPNVPGEGGGFSDIEPALSTSLEVRIGACLARCISVRDVIAAATRLILDDPSALLRHSDDAESRYTAALRQRIAYIQQTER